MVDELLSNGGDDRIEELRKKLDEVIERNLDRASESASRLDRTLVTLSAGALVLSMTFVGRVVPAKSYLVVLFVAWACFVASLICVVLAMRMIQNALDAAVRTAGDTLKLIDENLPAARAALKKIRRDAPLSRKRITRQRWVERLNKWALVSFLVGIVLLGIFVGVSLWTTNSAVGERCPAIHSPPF